MLTLHRHAKKFNYMIKYLLNDVITLNEQFELIHKLRNEKK